MYDDIVRIMSCKAIAENAHAQLMNRRRSSKQSLALSRSPKHSRHPLSRPSNSSFPPRSISVAHCVRSFPHVPLDLTIAPHAHVAGRRGHSQWCSSALSSAVPNASRLLCASKRQPWTRGQDDFRRPHIRTGRRTSTLAISLV